MSKKPPTDETTERTPDEVIAAWNETARIGIAKDLDVKVRWSAHEIANIHNAYRRDVGRAVAPPPPKVPPPPPLVTAPPTSPPAADRAEERRRIEEASRYAIDVAELVDQDRRRAGLPSLPDAGDGVDGG